MNGDKRNLFLDIETTGLDTRVHVPLSIGILLDSKPNDPDPKALIVTIKPTEEQWERANPEALKINGFTWEKLEAEGVLPEQAKELIAHWLYENDVNSDTVNYIGQNPQFDVNFLRAFMGDELEWLGFPLDAPHDTIQMAKDLARKDRTIRFENFKGWGIARALGVEEEDALHTALGGIQAVKRNFYALVDRLEKVH